MKQNKHAINESTISTWIMVAIMVVVLFLVVANLFPTMTDAGQTLNDSGFPLGSLFLPGGAIWYVLAGGLIILIVKSFLSKSK
jgi:hypothetical protein